MDESENFYEKRARWLSQPRVLFFGFITLILITFFLAWFFERSLPFYFDTFVIAGVVVFSVTLFLLSWLIRPSSTNEAISPVDELNKDIGDAKKTRVILLAVTIAIGGYVGFQAVKVIQIADRGGVENQYIAALRQNIEREQINFNNISNSAEATGEDRDNLLSVARARLDEASSRYIEELRKVDEGRLRVDGRFLFDFFSSFFVRVASVAISLTFFAVALTQYRKVDARILELSQLKLAHMLAKTETNPSLLENYRRAVTIADAQTKSLQDDTEVTIPREIFNNMLGAVDRLGVSKFMTQDKTSEKG